MKSETGFTLIELVMVIVIIGILAAIALPRIVNLEDEARQARIEAEAANITASSTMNYASCSANDHTAGSGDCQQVDNCVDAAGLVGITATAGTGAANAYNVEQVGGGGSDVDLTTNGQSAQCNLHFGNNPTLTARFNIIGAAVAP